MRSRHLSPDEALIALMIAAMEASGHAAPIEAARASALVALMPQFRRHSRLIVNKMIERMRGYVGNRDDDTVIEAAWRAIPPGRRAAAVMTVIAVLMSDHRLQRAEAAFLMKLSSRLPGACADRRPRRAGGEAR